jgi:lipopolysaccharide transport system ATP-binding protein
MLPATAELREDLQRPSYAYRHGDGSAEILGAELTDAQHAKVEIIETGEPLLLRILVRFKHEVESPVIGFLLRNSHGIHAYGTNTKEQQVEFGTVRTGETLEVSFSFNCWLGVDQYSISLAVHSREGQAYDWLDAALFLRVTSMGLTEGIANLNASVTAQHRSLNSVPLEKEERDLTAKV